jgi:hypothetical protein
MALVEVTKLEPRDNGVARFLASCACGTRTVLHVPVAQAVGANVGGYQCDGCGLTHRFAIAVTANGAL